jgi:hypothetical protein
MRWLYKYPQRPFPYEDLLRTNRERGREAGEYELEDTGVFDEGRYFDVFVDYAKQDVDDLCMEITVHNRGPEAASLHVLPTVWFRNTWFDDDGNTWFDDDGELPRPRLEETSPTDGITAIAADHGTLGHRWLLADSPACPGPAPRLLFTENETNRQRLTGEPNPTRYVKDGIDRCVRGEAEAVNAGQVGTRAAVWHRLDVDAGDSARVRVRLCDRLPDDDPLGEGFTEVLRRRHAEADEFYATVQGGSAGNDDACRVQRQAFAGLLWSKQFYHYDVSRWLREDERGRPLSRPTARNRGWTHLHNEDVISMPDKWEYPWYASWDLAFHCIPLALIDPDFAKEQLILFLREWYQHPNGQMPAYEWAFDDVNPPVHAWAVWRVYKIEERLRGEGDRAFLERAFHKLLLNFTWWVNRKDTAGNNIFQGGFLGLDNIGVFDRSAPLPTGGTIEQSDGTSWMGMFCLNMLAIALELARHNRAYSDIASKFFEHFTYIAHAINHVGDENLSLWDEEEGFFYDALSLPDGSNQLLKVRSMVGLITLFAVETLDPEVVEELPGFRRRMLWFIENRAHLRQHIAFRPGPREDGPPRRLLAIVGRDRLRRVLKPLLDEGEFLSPYGVRALSKRHGADPYVLRAGGQEYRVAYEPAESRSGMFGGNSNWRGPVWFPVNFLLIESLQRFHYYYGDEYRVECPTGSGQMLTLEEVAAELSRRLCRLFVRDPEGRRPAFGDHPLLQQDEHFRDHLLFHEYFHGDNGRGLGASHQTGWTALVAKLLQQTPLITGPNDEDEAC